MNGLILVIVSFAVLVLFVHKGVVIVPQGYAYKVERFGKFTRALQPGMHIIIPFFDRISNMEGALETPSHEVITKDGVLVRVGGVVYYQVVDPAAWAIVVDYYYYPIVKLVMINFRSVISSIDLDQLLVGRDQINAHVLERVDEVSAQWGIKVTRIEIRDILPEELVYVTIQRVTVEHNKCA